MYDQGSMDRIGRLMRLRDLVAAGQMAPDAAPLPMNTLRNNTTGAEYRLDSVPQGGAGGQSPQLDYSQPIEIFGQGKGYAIKGQPLSAMINGRRVDYGVDDAASKLATQRAQDLAMKRAEQQQGLDSGALDIQRKQADMAGGRRPAAPSGYMWNEDGSAVKPIPGFQKESVPTEDERKSAGYAVRMESALNLVKKVGEEDKKSIVPGGKEVLASALGNTAGTLARSDNRQRVYNAQLDALDAALTLATGAAYTRGQLQNLHQSYFPQYGEGPKSIADKAARLQDIIETARMRAGRVEPKADEVLNRSGQYGSGADRARAEFEARKAAISGDRKAANAGADQTDSFPDPRKEVGTIITDNSTGVRMRSDGRQWRIIGRGGGGGW